MHCVRSMICSLDSQKTLSWPRVFPFQRFFHRSDLAGFAKRNSPFTNPCKGAGIRSEMESWAQCSRIRSLLVSILAQEGYSAFRRFPLLGIASVRPGPDSQNILNRGSIMIESCFQRKILWLHKQRKTVFPDAL